MVEGVGSKPYFVPERTEKQIIVLHNVPIYGIEAVVRSYATEKVGLAYLIDKDGRVFNCFDPEFWAPNTGIGGDFDRKVIGIGLVNDGWLVMKKYDYFLSEFGVYGGKVYRHPLPWRGYVFYASYPEEQIEACARLVASICVEFSIPKKVFANMFEYDDKALKFNGIVGHCTLRPDKRDVSIAFPVEKFENILKKL